MLSFQIKICETIYFLNPTFNVRQIQLQRKIKFQKKLQPKNQNAQLLNGKDDFKNIIFPNYFTLKIYI